MNRRPRSKCITLPEEPGPALALLRRSTRLTWTKTTLPVGWYSMTELQLPTITPFPTMQTSADNAVPGAQLFRSPRLAGLYTTSQSLAQPSIATVRSSSQSQLQIQVSQHQTCPLLEWRMMCMRVRAQCRGYTQSNPVQLQLPAHGRTECRRQKGTIVSLHRSLSPHWPKLPRFCSLFGVSASTASGRRSGKEDSLTKNHWKCPRFQQCLPSCKQLKVGGERHYSPQPISYVIPGVVLG